MSHRFKHLLLFATRFTCLCSCLLIVRLTSWQWSYLRRIRTRSLSWLAFEEQKQTQPAFHPHLRLFGSSGEEQQASAPPLCLRCAPLRACRFDDICEVKEPLVWKDQHGYPVALKRCPGWLWHQQPANERGGRLGQGKKTGMNLFSVLVSVRFPKTPRHEGFRVSKPMTVNSDYTVLCQ
jgi:hypothetical protein